jgi:hypothetical protein
VGGTTLAHKKGEALMIDADRAMEIANAEAANLGWGGVSARGYDAISATVDGRSAWCIEKREIVIGHQLLFVIDAETGEILKKRRLGTR